MIRKSFLFCLLVLLSLPETSNAEEALSSLTLADARRLAFERNWDFLAARADLSFAEAARVAARAFPNPALSLLVQKINTDGAPASTQFGNSFFDRNYDTIVALNQLVEVGGKRKARSASASAGLEAARARFADARRRLDAGVVRAYVAAVAARENARIATLSAESLARSAEIAGERFRAGEISASERDQVEIAAGRFEADIRTAEATALQATIGLEVLLGERRPSGKIALTDAPDRVAAWASALLEGPDLKRSPEELVEGRPDLRAAAASLERAEADWKLQKALRVPDPTFLVQYERQPPDQRNTVGFGIVFPLPLLYRNAGGIRAAEVARESARRDLAQARARARSEVEAARVTHEAARKRRSLIQDRLLPKALAVRETIAFAYEKGGASVLALLEAERSLNDVRLAAAQATSDSVSTAMDLLSALAVSLGDSPR